MYGSSDFLDSKATYAFLSLCAPVPVGFGILVKNAGASVDSGSSAHVSGSDLRFLSLLAVVIVFFSF